MKQLEDEGAIERKGAERTGKPGRPAQLWGLTEAEKKRLGGRRREVPKMPCGCMAWPGREFCAHNPAPADAQGGSW